MTTTFSVNPTDPSGETFLYPHERDMPCDFAFDEGITILVGANGAGKTTLAKRLREALEREGTPVAALMKESIDSEMERQYAFAGDIDALMARIGRSHLSEGQSAKQDFAYLLSRIRQTMHATSDSAERWALIDGMDSSQSIDQLREMSDLLDLIVEDAPEGVRPYVIVTTNSFELAKGRRCLCVSENAYVTPRTYRDFSAAVMRSARYLKKRRTVSDDAWDDTYSSMPAARRAD